MLLQSLKEHHICSDMTPDDVFFYYTTTYVNVPVQHTNVRSCL
jgi:hypothetical protein